MTLPIEVLAALKTLGLEPPITANSLKTAFRRCSKIEHPDLSKHPKAKERFEAVVTANSLILNHPELMDAVDSSIATTDEGNPLSSLGKGLGATVNGKMCDDCNGLGYQAFIGRTVPCSDCRTRRFMAHLRLYEYRCRKCLGSGLFKMKAGRSGTCYPCQGSGWVRIQTESPFQNSCPTCKGTTLVEDRRRKTYHTCFKCKGSGELPMWNPVLPKGFLGSFGV